MTQSNDLMVEEAKLMVQIDPSTRQILTYGTVLGDVENVYALPYAAASAQMNEPGNKFLEADDETIRVEPPAETRPADG